MYVLRFSETKSQRKLVRAFFCIRKKQLSLPQKPPPCLKPVDGQFTVQVRRCNGKSSIFAKTVEGKFELKGQGQGHQFLK